MSPIQPIRILVIDDEPYLCDLTKEYLEKSEDMEAETACSVSKARLALSKRHFDAIVSDYQMPGEDGIQFLKSLRNDGDTIPFILFTGKGREEVVIEALNNGADSYLQKGGMPESQYVELEHRIRAAVQKHRAEEALRESEARFKQLAEHARTVTWEIDADGLFTYVSNASETIWGYHPDELVGKKHFYDLILEARRASAQAMTTETFQRQEPLMGLEGRILTKDGQIMWVSTNGVPLLNKDGTLRGYQGSETDIDDRKRAEEALRESEQRYKMISETTTDFVFSCVRPEGGEYAIDWMAGDVEGILGYSIEEMRTMRCWGRLVLSEDASIFHENVADLPPGTSQDCVLRIRTKSGEVRWLAVNTTHPSSREDPSYHRVFGGCTDISERKRAEQTLQEGLQRLENVIEGTRVGTWEWNVQTGETVFNERWAQIVGYTLDELAPIRINTWEALVHPDDLERSNVLLQRHFSGVSPHYEFEGRMKHKEGHWVWIVDRGRVVERAADGKPLMMFGTHTDITERKQAEEALRDSENHYRAIYDGSPIAIELYDAEGSLVHANPACLDLFGVDDAQEVGGFSLFADPNINERHKEELRRGNTIRYQGPFDFEMVRALDLYRTRRSGIIELDVLIAPLRGGEGSVMGFLVQIQDITERNRAEMELASALRRLEEANRLAHIGNWDWTIADDRVVWSEELYRITGRDPSCPAPTYAEHPQVYSPNSWNSLSAAVQRAMETGEPYDIELEVIRPDGSVRNTIAIGGAKRDVMGKVVGLHGLLQDITERQQLLRSLKEAAYARILIDAILDPLVAIDREGKITDANAAALQLFDMGRERTIGTDFSAHFEESKRAKEATLEAFRNGAVRNLSLTMGRHSGMKVDVLCNASNYGGEDGNVIGVIAAIRDISEFKRMEDALSIANSKLNLLSSITRHDLRNKLTIVSGELELIAAEVATPHPEVSFHNARNAISQCYSIIDFTREYETMGISPPSWQNPHDAVEQATRELNHEGVRIVNEVPRDLQLISDPLIKKVFYNLMENAVRHGVKVTLITFSVKEIEGSCVILCEDNGIGVRPDQKESIFNRGFGKNTGFGLFLCREILAITGITITETGKAGEGVRFEMLVPAGAWRLAPP